MDYVVYVPVEGQLAGEVDFWRRVWGLRERALAPHCTLFYGSFSERDEWEMRESLASIVQHSFPARLDGLALFDNDAVVSRVRPDSDLTVLHYKVAERLKVFAKKEVPPKDEALVPAYAEFGWGYAGENWSPHVTVGYGFLRGSESPLEGRSFRVGEIVLARRNGSWQDVARYFLRD